MTSSWKKVLRSNIRSFVKLFQYLQLDDTTIQLVDQNPHFPLNLPLRLAEKMQKNCPDDPLFLQFVPLKKEKIQTQGFDVEPVQDSSFQTTPKLLHKYKARSLIITTSACAMHCRYCFRQNYDYDKEQPEFEREIEAIKNDPEIEEVILSGGDPLSLSDRVLCNLMGELNAITHVRRIRFHSRFILGIPERIDANFIEMLQRVSKQLWFVIHVNHPNEFDSDIWNALKKIQLLGIPVLNQSVLLRGINDTLDVQMKLSEELVNHGVIPYYLHQLDKVQGTSHFEVPIEKGKDLANALHASISGYGVPKYVQEIPKKPAKTLL